MRTARTGALIAILLAVAPLCGAQPLADSLVLVAKPELEDSLYGRTVLVVKAFGKDQHFGFIINRPTALKLGVLFPGHAPSQQVSDPVYLGGPVKAGAIFVLVARGESPGSSCMQIMPGLYAAIDARSVDRIIEADPDDARYVTGLVTWRPGELRHEIAQGVWYVLKSDSALVLREPKGLWEELVGQASSRRH